MASILATSFSWRLQSRDEDNDGDTDMFDLFADMEVTTQPDCPLLNLPVEMVSQILEHLLPESAAAFALTCKAAFSLFFDEAKQRINLITRPNLLMLLEEGQSHRAWFCHECKRLHPLNPAWTCDPGVALGRADRFCLNSLTLPYRRLSWVPDTYAPGFTGLGFHHFKLVTNAHLWGPEHGMSLAWLHRENPGIRDHGDRGWKIGHSARISREGQLFLCVTHKALLLDGELVYGHNPRAQHFICHHIAHGINIKGGRGNWMMIPELKHYRDGDRTPGKPMASCDICLTDYTTTIKRRKDYPFDKGAKNHANLYEITIKSYHQLGLCRSPTDPVWVAFATPALMNNPVFAPGAPYNNSGYIPRNSPPDFLPRTNPDFAPLEHAKGSIKRQWNRLR